MFILWKFKKSIQNGIFRKKNWILLCIDTNTWDTFNYIKFLQFSSKHITLLTKVAQNFVLYKIGNFKNKINFRLCSERDNSKLSGYNHNAVTPFGMKFNMPIVFSHSILLDNLDFFLGGGEVDLKIKLNSTEFIDKMSCLVADIANWFRT